MRTTQLFFKFSKVLSIFLLFTKKENDTKKNCLKTVWGFKMSFFEEQIEFNFRFSLKPDVCLGSLAQMYAF
jgi:hypothetical protein